MILISIAGGVGSRRNLTWSLVRSPQLDRSIPPIPYLVAAAELLKTMTCKSARVWGSLWMTCDGTQKHEVGSVIFTAGAIEQPVQHHDRGNRGFSSE